MLCVTGMERTVDRLAERLARGPREAMHEVRLDALDGAADDALDLVTRHARRAVVCVRPTRQGGWYRGDETSRIELLVRAARSGCSHIDVEADCERPHVQRIVDAARGRVVISHHDHVGIPEDLGERMDAMASLGADVIKVAVAVDDAADLEILLDHAERTGGPTVLVGMGDAGLLSRCRYPAFGAPWTYVSATDGTATAPGQLSSGTAMEMGLPASSRAPFVALLGGPQIGGSPGPRVYNRLFREMGIEGSYVPVITDRLEETLALLHRLGARGASVTMPHKVPALNHADAREPAANAVGACNSLRFDGPIEVATNTDVAGIHDPLMEAITKIRPRVRSAMILGAGGAARAAVQACHDLDLRVTVCARSERRARATSRNGIEVLPWEQRGTARTDVLINATPLSGSDSPLGGTPPDPGTRVVFDLAMGRSRSRLIDDARTVGARTLGPDVMWVAQGARQMSWITGRRITTAMIEEVLP